MFAWCVFVIISSVILNFFYMFEAENRKCANIQSIFIQKHFCPEKLSSAGHSHFGCSLAVKCKKKVCLWCIWNTLWLCSCQWHGLLGTKWLHSWLCYHDFQIIWLNFRLLINWRRNQVKNCCVSFFFFFFSSFFCAFFPFL